MSVPFEKLLENVARELAYEARLSADFQRSADAILRRDLLPLLQAGQAMRDECAATCDFPGCNNMRAWDAERERLAGLGGGANDKSDQ